jgi:uncharacterized C2H2 Zn-finger protein
VTWRWEKRQHSKHCIYRIYLRKLHMSYVNIHVRLLHLCIHFILYWLFLFSFFTEIIDYQLQSFSGIDFKFQEPNRVSSCQQQTKFGTETHFCPSCGKVYTWKISLQRHMRTRCGKEPDLPCPYCPYVTNHKSSIQKHIFKQHKDKLNIQ